MKKLFLFLFLIFPAAASAKINIVATLPVFASLAREVGGDRVDVTSLARGNQDPHFLDAKPTFVVALSHADVLLHGGLDLEVGWLPVLIAQARNSKILPHSPGNVDLSQGLEILEIPEGRVDRSMGDVHPAGNPHTWLHPRNAKIMAAAIAERLATIDPAGKSDYAARAKDFLSRLDKKIVSWEDQAAGLRGMKVITYHKSFTYFTHWLGLEVMDYIEPKPGIPPSSRHVDHLLDKIPGLGVSLLLVESFYPKKVPEYISQKTGVPFQILPTDTDEFGIRSYTELIDFLIARLYTVKR